VQSSTQSFVGVAAALDAKAASPAREVMPIINFIRKKKPTWQPGGFMEIFW
jgi:hypothetical protein